MTTTTMAMTKTARLHALWVHLAALLALLLVLGVLAPQARAQTTSITFFHNDVLGSPAVATDASGAVVWKESYLPYGHRLQAPAAGANDKLWYAGKQLDPHTGLSYMGARYYSPVVGRFMGVDPVEFKEDNIHSLNRYAYANNNPYRYVDPDGRQAQPSVYPNFDPMEYLRSLAIESGKFIAMASGGAGGAAEKVAVGVAAAKETAYLYRGVSVGHPVIDAAKQGRVMPGNVNGTVSAEAHNLGGQAASSPFTSWTRDPAIAATHAAKNGPGGVVLRVPQVAPPAGAKWSWEWSPDVWGESEVLMRGIRSGVEVIK